jgi:serpin B
MTATLATKDRVNNFGQKLYGQLCAKEGNLFYSPYSIAVALGMTGSGAAGETLAEFTNLFGHNLDDSFGKLVKEVNDADQKDFMLKSANALWVQKGLGFNEGYATRIKKLYGGAFEQVDYVAAPDAAVSRINSWTNENTNGKITELVTRDTINPDTRLVLTNAIYFKGSWVKAFEAENTLDGDFHTPKKAVKAKLMHQTAKYAYQKTDDEQVIDLPYKGHDLVMTVILPRELPLSEYESTLTQEKIDNLTKSMYSQEVNVVLPRFKTTAEFQLRPTLNKLGMNMAFSDHADFSNITSEEDLKISAVIHKAFVEVNEEGTEAAAATAVSMMLCASFLRSDEPEYFRADKPFFFLIRNRKTGTVYFTGRITDPTK